MLTSIFDYTTRPASPKVVREQKSRDFDTQSIRSPRDARREKATDLKKSIFGDLHRAMIQNPNSSMDRYRIDNDDFAKGAYGKVSLATDRITKQRVVIKKIMSTTPIRMVNNEVRAGKILGEHPNIAAFVEYSNERPEYHLLVFQFVPGQDLFTHLEKSGFSPKSEAEARIIITQILKALQHIHSHSIAHRDIKLENILIDPKSSKTTVIDLGLCGFIENEKLCREWCGSDNYLAPEIVRRTPYDGFLADVFSTGVVLFALLFGVFPFENLRVAESSFTKGPIKKLHLKFPAEVLVTDSAKELLTRMLEDDPSKRISVKDILQHKWILDGKAPLMESTDINLNDIFEDLKISSCESVPIVQ